MSGIAEAVRSREAAPTRVGARRWLPFSLWWPIAIFAATRLYAFVVIASGARNQTALPYARWPAHPGSGDYYVNSPTPAAPGYLRAITNWDGQWYQQIAVNGYRIPASGDPHASDVLWSWAFPPGFPLTARFVMQLTGLDFPIAATVVNLVAGAAAMVVLFRLLERTGGHFLAASGVALTCCFVTAPLLQAAYSESLAFLLLCGALLLVQRRRYGWAIPVVASLAFTRIITPPLAAVVAIHALARWRNRKADAISAKHILLLAALFGECLSGVWFWSTVVERTIGVGTGASSRTGVSQGLSLGWFSDLFDAIGWGGPATLILMCCVLALLALDRRRTGRWGLELRTWLWAYPLFVFAVTPLTSGVLRYLLLAFPLNLLVAGNSTKPSRPRLALVIVSCMVGLGLQMLWINHALLIIDPATHTQWMP